MSEDSTSNIDNAIPQSEELRSSNVEQNDAGLADRTQQLIDEVNQLLGTDQPSPESPSQETKAETNSVEIENNNLGNAAETLRNFLDSLGSTESDQSEPQVESIPAATQIHEIVETANETVKPGQVEEKIAEPGPATEIDESASLESQENGAFKSVLEERADAQNQLVEETLVETGTLQQEVQAEPEVVVQPAAIAEPAVEAVSELEAAFDIAEESNEAVDANDVRTQEDVTHEDVTQKYLDEIKSAFDATNEAEPSERHDNVVETVESVEDDSAAPSVESWLAANVKETVAEEAEDESGPTESESTEAETTEPADVANMVDVNEDTNDEPAPSSAVFAPTLVFDSEINDTDEIKSSGDENFDRLEASINKRLRKLEERIGGMFSSITDQIDRLVESGIPSPNAVAQNVRQGVASENAGDSGENVGSESDAGLESADSVQPKADSDKIDALKEQLTSKLREAEIELSINRAKLSQQRASIEQMQADLERREAAVEAKLEQAKKSAASGKRNGGIMDRWKRHLGD